MTRLFRLHQRLLEDTCFVVDWSLSRVLLVDDCRFPWLVLTPRRSGVSEIHELQPEDRASLMEEIARAGAGLLRVANMAKINIGALGNQVPQLHVHVVARSADDPAWPSPVWGQGEAIRYAPAARVKLIGSLREALDPRETSGEPT